MRVLLVTGKLAEGRVREIASKYGCRVFVAREEVASLIKPKALAGDLTGQGAPLEEVDLILVPGLILGDIRVVEEAAGVRTYRGPRDVADLDAVLANLGRMRLSKHTPADKLLSGKLRKRAAEELREVKTAEYIRAKMRNPGNFMIGGLPVGPDFPARVIAEVVGADGLSDKEVLERARYYLREGADIIDIGMNHEDPGRAVELVRLLRKLGAPVSIDTMEEENIRAALDAGVDLVLSFDHELLLEFSGVATPSVVIPRKEGIPSDPEERVKVLEENIALARRRGFSRIIADPLLQPLTTGFVDSVLAYKEFSRRQELPASTSASASASASVPMLMGVGNVTELLDADSPGVNALLCGIAMELGACLLFTTEAGDKTRGSVRELSTAAKMMYLSSRRGCLPKDLGIDLLILKEKKIKRDLIKVKNIEKIKARRKESIQMDKKGYFRIFIDEKINCIHYYKNKPHLLIEGRKAREICDTIYSLGLVADIGHALYLGRELARAEEALTRGGSYKQG